LTRKQGIKSVIVHNVRDSVVGQCAAGSIDWCHANGGRTIRQHPTGSLTRQVYLETWKSAE